MDAPRAPQDEVLQPPGDHVVDRTGRVALREHEGQAPRDVGHREREAAVAPRRPRGDRRIGVAASRSPRTCGGPSRARRRTRPRRACLPRRARAPRRAERTPRAAAAARAARAFAFASGLRGERDHRRRGGRGRLARADALRLRYDAPERPSPRERHQDHGRKDRLLHEQPSSEHRRRGPETRGMSPGRGLRDHRRAHAAEARGGRAHPRRTPREARARRASSVRGRARAAERVVPGGSPRTCAISAGSSPYLQRKSAALRYGSSSDSIAARTASVSGPSGASPGTASGARDREPVGIGHAARAPSGLGRLLLEHVQQPGHHRAARIGPRELLERDRKGLLQHVFRRGGVRDQSHGHPEQHPRRRVEQRPERLRVSRRPPSRGVGLGGHGGDSRERGHHGNTPREGRRAARTRAPGDIRPPGGAPLRDTPPRGGYPRTASIPRRSFTNPGQDSPRTGRQGVPRGRSRPAKHGGRRGDPRGTTENSKGRIHT